MDCAVASSCAHLIHRITPLPTLSTTSQTGRLTRSLNSIKQPRGKRSRMNGAAPSQPLFGSQASSQPFNPIDPNRVNGFQSQTNGAPLTTNGTSSSNTHGIFSTPSGGQFNFTNGATPAPGASFSFGGNGAGATPSENNQSKVTHIFNFGASQAPGPSSINNGSTTPFQFGASQGTGAGSTNPASTSFLQFNFGASQQPSSSNANSGSKLTSQPFFSASPGTGINGNAANAGSQSAPRFNFSASQPMSTSNAGNTSETAKEFFFGASQGAGAISTNPATSSAPKFSFGASQGISTNTASQPSQPTSKFTFGTNQGLGTNTSNTGGPSTSSGPFSFGGSTDVHGTSKANADKTAPQSGFSFSGNTPSPKPSNLPRKRTKPAWLANGLVAHSEQVIPKGVMKGETIYSLSPRTEEDDEVPQFDMSAYHADKIIDMFEKVPDSSSSGSPPQTQGPSAASSDSSGDGNQPALAAAPTSAPHPDAASSKSSSASNPSLSSPLAGSSAATAHVSFSQRLAPGPTNPFNFKPPTSAPTLSAGSLSPQRQVTPPSPTKPAGPSGAAEQARRSSPAKEAAPPSPTKPQEGSTTPGPPSPRKRPSQLATSRPRSPVKPAESSISPAAARPITPKKSDDYSFAKILEKVEADGAKAKEDPIMPNRRLSATQHGPSPSTNAHLSPQAGSQSGTATPDPKAAPTLFQNTPGQQQSSAHSGPSQTTNANPFTQAGPVNGVSATDATATPPKPAVQFFGTPAMQRSAAQAHPPSAYANPFLSTGSGNTGNASGTQTVPATPAAGFFSIPPQQGGAQSAQQPQSGAAGPNLFTSAGPNDTKPTSFPPIFPSAATSRGAAPQVDVSMHSASSDQQMSSPPQPEPTRTDTSMRDQTTQSGDAGPVSNTQAGQSNQIIGYDPNNPSFSFPRASNADQLNSSVQNQHTGFGGSMTPSQPPADNVAQKPIFPTTSNTTSNMFSFNAPSTTPSGSPFKFSTNQPPAPSFNLFTPQPAKPSGQTSRSLFTPQPPKPAGETNSFFPQLTKPSTESPSTNLSAPQPAKAPGEASSTPLAPQPSENQIGVQSNILTSQQPYTAGEAKKTSEPASSNLFASPHPKVADTPSSGLFTPQASKSQIEIPVNLFSKPPSQLFPSTPHAPPKQSSGATSGDTQFGASSQPAQPVQPLSSAAEGQRAEPEPKEAVPGPKIQPDPSLSLTGRTPQETANIYLWSASQLMPSPVPTGLSNKETEQYTFLYRMQTLSDGVSQYKRQVHGSKNLDKLLKQAHYYYTNFSFAIYRLAGDSLEGLDPSHPFHAALTENPRKRKHCIEEGETLITAKRSQLRFSATANGTQVPDFGFPKGNKRPAGETVSVTDLQVPGSKTARGAHNADVPSWLRSNAVSEKVKAYYAQITDQSRPKDLEGAGGPQEQHQTAAVSPRTQSPSLFDRLSYGQDGQPLKEAAQNSSAQTIGTSEGANNSFMKQFASPKKPLQPLFGSNSQAGAAPAPSEGGLFGASAPPVATKPVFGAASEKDTNAKAGATDATSTPNANPLAAPAAQSPKKPLFSLTADAGNTPKAPSKPLFNFTSDAGNTPKAPSKPLFNFTADAGNTPKAPPKPLFNLSADTSNTPKAPPKPLFSFTADDNTQVTNAAATAPSDTGAAAKPGDPNYNPFAKYNPALAAQPLKGSTLAAPDSVLSSAAPSRTASPAQGTNAAAPPPASSNPFAQLPSDPSKLSAHPKLGLPGSVLSSAASSRAGTPGGTTGEESNAEGSGTGGGEGDAMPADEQSADLSLSTAGEEGEEVLVQHRAKAKAFVAATEGGEKGWTTKGVGELKVLKNTETGKVRVVLRADKSGKVVMNAGLLPSLVYGKAASKVVDFPLGTARGIERWILQFSAEDLATSVSQTLEAGKGI